MIIDEDTIILSTGRKLYCNRGIVGISPELELYGGYDQSLWQEWMEEDRKEWDEGYKPVTKEELFEIADYMILQWQKFKDHVII